MKKIAIIGANSYIARNVLYSLNHAEEQYDIQLYDYADEHVDGNLQYKKIQILNPESVSEIDMDCDVIFMFVGKTGSANGFDEYKTFVDINEMALLNVLNEYRRQNSSAKIIFPSTRLVYKGKKGILSEDSEKEFKTIYAINKYACEEYLKQFSNVFGIRYCIFRICVPYGTLIPNATSYGTAEFMLKKATNGENITLYGDGAVRRTLTYMGDLCNVMIRGAFDDNCINDIYNIGGEDYSLKEMAELIAQKYSVGVDYVEWPEVAWKIESGDTVFDDSKLRNILGNIIVSKFADWVE